MSVCLCLLSMQNVVPVGEGDLVDVPQDSESQLQEQEKRIEISCALATEASRRGRMLSGERGRASLLQGDRLTRCRGGSSVLRGGQGQRDRQDQDKHLLSTRYCARLRGVQRGQSCIQELRAMVTLPAAPQRNGQRPRRKQASPPRPPPPGQLEERHRHSQKVITESGWE